MRYLFGPAASSFASEYLTTPRSSSMCLTFPVDVQINGDELWADVARRFPACWVPDRVVVWLNANTIPAAVWASPVPVIGVLGDWDLLGHYARHVLPLCDVVLAEPLATQVMHAAGFGHVRPATVSGLGRSSLAADQPARDRDIDVLVIDELSPAVRRERLTWAARVAQMGCRVVVRRPTTAEADRALLRRAKLVVQLPPDVGPTSLTDEALAAGATLLRPATTSTDDLRPGVDYIPYDTRTLEAKIRHGLNHPAEARRIANAGHARREELLFSTRLARALSALDAEWPAIVDRARQRVAAGVTPGLGHRVWTAVGGTPLPADGPESQEWLIARGCLAEPAEAVGLFQQARTLDPGHPVAACNLAEALVRGGRVKEAAAVATEAVEQLDRASPRPFVAWDVPLYPRTDLLARAEWERLVWFATGDPTAEAEAKRTFLRSRLHALLARTTDDLSHYHEAAVARPDLPGARAGLGCALARRGRLGESLSHLKAAVATDPFDAAAADAYQAALRDTGDALGRRLFARQQWRLATAAPDAYPARDWFADAGPVGDELASVVVVVHDQADLTRLCLDALCAYTRPPFELILVDNGSAPETAEVLEGYARRAGPARVSVARTGRNLGYPAAANQGLRLCHGDFVVLLNNDAIPTPGWLNHLVAHIVEGWPRIGLVGPLTNAAPDPQRLPAGYADLADLPRFAVEHHERSTGGEAVPRLSGFCLLTHREVLNAVGPLDEQFGAGFFDDDDWCVRVRQAGYSLLLARDTYVHHFGSATFRGLGVDTDALLVENLAKFRAKWGDAAAAPYRLPAANGPPTVSLCLIVKDEEHNLADCLASVRDLVNEVVVVDTGSTDRTKAMALEFGAKVFDFPWVDNFAAARNECLRHATGRWIFWMDADDRLPPADRATLRDLFANLPAQPTAFVMKCRCPSAGGGVTVVDHVRLFPNDARLRWQYRVHEQILPAVRAASLPVRWADVTITHVGYIDPAHRGRKLDRDLRLLRIEEEEQPDDPFTLFNLGSVLWESSGPAAARPYLERSLAGSHPQDSIVRKLYALIAQAHLADGAFEEAGRACRCGRQLYPDDAELLFTQGQIHEGRGEWEDAIDRWRELIDGRDGEHFGSVDSGLRGHRAWHHLALAYVQLGEYSKAEAAWQDALTDEPGFRPAEEGLQSLSHIRRH